MGNRLHESLDYDVGAMLPSERIELAFYTFVDRLGPGRVTTNLAQLHQITGETDQGRIVERLKDLEDSNRLWLWKYSGGQLYRRADSPDQTFFYSGSFLIEIAPQGRKYFEELEHRAAEEARSTTERAANGGLIFVSCGQAAENERALGQAATELVQQETGRQAYFAQNQSSLEGLTENVLKQLHQAAGFIAIMHPRGNVTNPTQPSERSWVRGSVWIEQEIAIATFISQVLQRPIPARVYIHEDIRREGIRDQLMLNPVGFHEDTEVLADLRKFLPFWRSLVQQEPKQPLSLKPIIRAQRQGVPGGGDDQRYILVVDVENDGENDASEFTLDVEFPAEFVDSSGYIIEKPSSKPGIRLFGTDSKRQRIGHLFPTAATTNFLTIYFAIRGATLRGQPALLQKQVKAIACAQGMKPKVTTKTIAELMN